MQQLERFAHGVQAGQRSDIISFLAPPGLGKTCLLKKARKDLQAQGWFCGYSEAGSDPDAAVIDLLADAGDALPAEGIGAKFRAHVQEFNVSAGPVGIGLKLESQAESTIYAKFTRLLASLGDMAMRANTGVALIIDEAHALPRRNLELLLRTVNRLDEFPIGVILAGLPCIPDRIITGRRDEPTLPTMWHEPLPPLSWTHAELTLRVPVWDSEDSFEDEALDILVAFAQGHPLTLQMAGSAAWLDASRTVHDNRPLIINEINAQRAVELVRSQLKTTVYTPLWTKLQPSERAVLAAIAGCENTELRVHYENPRTKSNEPESYQDLFFRKYQIAMMSDRHGSEAVDELTQKGMVYFSPHSQLRLVIPGFADFINSRSSGQSQLI